jgi:hypothetical protein
LKIEEVEKDPGKKKQQEYNKKLQEHHEEKIALNGWNSFC